YYTLTAASEKALIYEPIGTFKHRIVFLVEATALLKDENSLLALCIRALQSEQEFRYPVLVLQDNGPPVTVMRIQPGPTSLLVTTTKSSLHAENETRQLSMELDASAEQTKNILAAQSTGVTIRDLDPAPWRAYHRWIECGPHEVLIPYHGWLNELVDASVVRM